MAGLIQMLTDWTAVRKLKKGLMSALEQTPPGAGISIDNPHDPVTARAIIELLNENFGKLEIIDHGFSVNLMRKVGMEQSMSKETYQNLRGSYDILDAQALDKLRLSNEAKLPARRWRGGVPDDVNTSGAVLLDKDGNPSGGG